MSELGFRAFDADNHYYEAEDAFTRHLDRTWRQRAIQWADVGGRRCLLVAGKVNKFIPNPTFDPVAKPGCLDEYFRGRNPEGKSIREIFGDLEPISPAYRNRDARLELMDEQNLDACLMFPTLGVGMEEPLAHDPPAMLAAFSAFNRWIEEDWGFAYQGRIFSAPYITLADPQWAAKEVDWALSRGLKILNLRAAPALVHGVHHSPADPIFDAFWARVNEAGIAVAIHSGDSGYLKYTEMWGGQGEMQAFDFQPKRLCLSATPVHDMLATLICDGLFDRHKKLRVATIESGSSWVSSLLPKLKKCYGQLPMLFERDPIEAFREHVFVSPYYEDDIAGLREQIGADHILFGSDYPHGEGLADPVSFVNDLPGFSKDDVRRIMRDNGYGLVAPRAN
jgi:predicted TIM-barrel fold metal-dependent hydrolase